MSGEAGSMTRILFVDDSKVMLKTASKILSAEFDAITAVDGDDAWEKLERDHEIQVLFTDINMPGTDGYGLLAKVRTADDPGLHDMPVILVTGADDDEAAKQQALDRGATDFLNKKFISTELLTRARAHAKYQRISKQLQEQATLDPLTGLSNEHGFLVRLDQDIAYARRHGQELAVMRLEIDDLAATLQECGNAVVEQIVVHVASLIRKRIREEDTAGRIGLGGFAIALPGGQLDGIKVMAAWLHDKVATHAVEVDGRAIPIRLSTAVIGAEQDVWSTAAEALDRSRAALEHARQRPPAMAEPETVEQPQPAVSEATPLPAEVTAPEPATAQATPTYESPRRDALRDWAKQRPTREVIRKKPNVLQRLLAFLRSYGANLRARFVRFLKKLVGK
jgi:diguanylate cyclase (GGDEF)-like protein